MRLKELIDSNASKGSLLSSQLKRVIRAASTGSRIIADSKIVWKGQETGIFNSKKARDAWEKGGNAFSEKMKAGVFIKVVIKDFENGAWVTVDDFDTSIQEG